MAEFQCGNCEAVLCPTEELCVIQYQGSYGLVLWNKDSKAPVDLREYECTGRIKVCRGELKSEKNNLSKIIHKCGKMHCFKCNFKVGSIHVDSKRGDQELALFKAQETQFCRDGVHLRCTITELATKFATTVGVQVQVNKSQREGRTFRKFDSSPRLFTSLVDNNKCSSVSGSSEKGTVVRVYFEKGYGFIKPVENHLLGNYEVFFHFNTVKRAPSGLKIAAQVGQQVEYRATNVGRQRWRATVVTLLCTPCGEHSKWNLAEQVRGMLQSPSAQSCAIEVAESSLLSELSHPSPDTTPESLVLYLEMIERVTKSESGSLTDIQRRVLESCVGKKGSLLSNLSDKFLYDYVNEIDDAVDQNMIRYILQATVRLILRFMECFPSDYRSCRPAPNQLLKYTREVFPNLQDPHPDAKEVCKALNCSSKDTSNDGRLTLVLAIHVYDRFKALQQNNSRQLASNMCTPQRSHEVLETPAHDLNVYKDLKPIPSIKELRGDNEIEAYFRRKADRFSSSSVYLDYFYRLLREDLIAPLRNAISEHETDRTKTFYTAQIVQFVAKRSKEDKEFGCHLLKLDFSGAQNKRLRTERFWNHSKTFIFGSLIALSNDNFENEIHWATIVNRNGINLEKDGVLELAVRFLTVAPVGLGAGNISFTVVESPAFFESYQHCLTNLQRMHEVPFGDLLLKGEKATCINNPPLYLKSIEEKGDLMDFSNLYCSKSGHDSQPFFACPTIAHLPKGGSLLDRSQLEAFKTLLTRQCPVIQGPPGTGKSFVAQKFLEFLLANKETVRKGLGRVPCDGMQILVLGYTNHAVDQLTSAVITAVPESTVVRLGSRSKDDQIQRVSLAKCRKQGRYDWDTLRRSSSKCESLGKDLEELDEEARKLHVELVPAGLFTLGRLQITYHGFFEALRSLAQDALSILDDLSLLKAWLGFEVYDMTEESDMNCQDGGWTEVVSKANRKAMLRRTAELQRQHLLAVLRFEYTKDFYRVDRIQNPWCLEITDRLRAIAHLRCCYRSNLESAFQDSLQRLKETEQILAARRTELDWSILRRMDIIAATVTGAARSIELLRKIRNAIVIFEEAAEVLEPQMLGCIPEDISQLVLFGDHKQLEPKTADFKVGTKYGLGVSLFERLVNIEVPFETLMIQRRMHPKISALARPLYPMLEDHDSVFTYPPHLRGLTTCLALMQCNFPEDGEDNNNHNGRSNRGEANLAVRLANYLVQQGYFAEKMAILTMYAGQVMVIREILRRGTAGGGLQEELTKVKISTVDDVQGEEFQTVVLSLVRSKIHDEGPSQVHHRDAGKQVGFVRKENRVNVSLSRAKEGMLVLGNFKHLANYSDVWRRIMSIQQPCSYIELTCSKHSCASIQTETVRIQCAKDIQFHSPFGGCKRPCVGRLECGHACKISCHTMPHSKVVCTQICGRTLDCGHKCTDICDKCQKSEDGCRPCASKCEKKLRCGHTCSLSCGVECLLPQNCVAKILVQRSCGHEFLVPCGRSNTELCPKTCDQRLSCGHLCPGTCGTCHFNPLYPQQSVHQLCKEDCKRTLVCGHNCAGGIGSGCSKACPLCEVQCERMCPHSRCSKKCFEECVPCRELCAWKCPHAECSKLCNEECDRLRCELRCEIFLPCGHQCKGVCGEECPSDCLTCNETQVVFDDSFLPTPAVNLKPVDLVIQLSCSCRAMVTVSAMDQLISTALDSEKVQFMSCPLCRDTMWSYPKRYTPEANKMLKTLDRVKEIQKNQRHKALEVAQRIQNEAYSLRNLPHELDSCVKAWLLIHSTEMRAKFHSADETNTLHHVFSFLKEVNSLLPKPSKKTEDPLQSASKKLCAFVSSCSDSPGLSTEALLEMKMDMSRAILLCKLEAAPRQSPAVDALIKEINVAKTLSQLDSLSKNAMRALDIDSVLVAVLETDPAMKAGHVYKCRCCGEPFFIGDCGGAMIQQKCLSCGKLVGGSNHALNLNSAPAPELTNGSIQEYMWDNGEGQRHPELQQ